MIEHAPQTTKSRGITVLQPPAEDFWNQADEYVGQMAEPFHAPNVLTNRGVWQEMASRGIKVSINGAAGDESWAGLDQHFRRR